MRRCAVGEVLENVESAARKRRRCRWGFGRLKYVQRTELFCSNLWYKDRVCLVSSSEWLNKKRCMEAKGCGYASTINASMLHNGTFSRRYLSLLQHCTITAAKRITRTVNERQRNGQRKEVGGQRKEKEGRIEHSMSQGKYDNGVVRHPGLYCCTVFVATHVVIF